MANKTIDLKGRRFDRLVVIERVENSKSGIPRWLCQCDCGETKVVSGAHLRNGTTRSCGCLRKETVGARSADIAREIGRKNKQHGMHGSRLYNIWRGAKDRCLNPNSKYYHRYGGRGITICDEWADSFESFQVWAMASGYQDNLTLDRKDNDGPYSQENCRWATQKEQANNRRNNRLVTYKGRTQTLQQWAEEYGLTKDALLHRLDANWPVEKALTEPLQR